MKNMSNYEKARKELSKLIGVKTEKISYVLYILKQGDRYKSFAIPKRNGGVRNIVAPQDDLKKIQRKLARFLYNTHSEFIKNNNIKANISHGFEKNKSIITNAKIHKNKKYVLNLDIQDFFPSFNFGRVRGFFMKSKMFKFSEEMATLIAQLTCYKGALPQGAPTSPIISNLIFNIIDIRILPLAKKYKLHYTRYADDLTFSTNEKEFGNNESKFELELTKLINESGFEINKEKTRLQYYYSRQEVTGLTVNKKVNVNKQFIKLTRAMAHELYKTGSFTINDEIGSIKQLEGRFSFINQLDVNYRNLKNNTNYYDKDKLLLNSREKQYRYFLFYKYFYNPEKTTIVTEGKTDSRYIKAALKKYHKEYPNLINKAENGNFNFKIHFLKKSDRLNKLLRINPDGGDTFVNIYSLYDGNKTQNLYKYISDIRHDPHSEKKNQVLILLDHELNKKRSPLKMFLDRAGFEKENGEYKNLKEHNYIIGNLHLLLTPNVKDSEDCEIEDLFKGVYVDSNDLIRNEMTEDGEIIEKSILSNYIGNKGVTKNDFSNYVLKTYRRIDFSNFIPLLDNISKIVGRN